MECLHPEHPRDLHHQQVHHRGGDFPDFRLSRREPGVLGGRRQRERQRLHGDQPLLVWGQECRGDAVPHLPGRKVYPIIGC